MGALRRYLENTGDTERAAALKMGVSRHTLCRWLSEKQSPKKGKLALAAFSEEDPSTNRFASREATRLAHEQDRRFAIFLKPGNMRAEQIDLRRAPFSLNADFR